ncbi:MAG: DMT family transporter [Geminicoccaceae bacterium]
MDPEQRQVLIALGLVIAGGVLFVIMNTLVKFLTTELNPVMLTWARYFFHVAFVVVVFPKSLLGVLRADRIPFQIGRSVLLLLATITNFIALALLPLAEVASIIFLAPIFVAGLAVLVLRERVVAWRWLPIGLGFSGALIIVQPQGGTFAGCRRGPRLRLLLCPLPDHHADRGEAQPIVSLLYGGLVGIVALTSWCPSTGRRRPSPSGCSSFPSARWGPWPSSRHHGALQRAEASKMRPSPTVQLLWAMIASYVVSPTCRALQPPALPSSSPAASSSTASSTCRGGFLLGGEGMSNVASPPAPASTSVGSTPSPRGRLPGLQGEPRRRGSPAASPTRPLRHLRQPPGWCCARSRTVRSCPRPTPSTASTAC